MYFKLRLITRIFLLFIAFPAATSLAAIPSSSVGNLGLTAISASNWGETPVRKILQAFAFGGLATDAQISNWARMTPQSAVAEMLTFNSVNALLSPPQASDRNQEHCDSLEAMQAFWSGNDPGNIMNYADRYRYAALNTSLNLSTTNLQRTWTKVISTRGCNPFLHKMALFLTNYYSSISVSKTRAGLIRDYYDDMLTVLLAGGDFVDAMIVAASHAAVARAYGHQYSTYNNSKNTYSGTDDFAREFHQLYFRIQGTTENTSYHEDTTIEHTAWLLTGMNLDKATNAYGAISSGEWWTAPLVFTNHVDNTGRRVSNFSNHYHSELGGQSCLEILHANICGSTAEEKITALAQVAALHPESMANVPVYIIDFFADDNLNETKILALRKAWSESRFDLLSFIRDYAISTVFHNSSTFKYRSAFDRNLVLQNAHILDNTENFARDYYDSPFARMAEQGAEVFEPAHDVFGGQTGFQAANNRYIFKDAFWANVENPTYFDDFDDTYTLQGGAAPPVLVWKKNWSGVIPLNAYGKHVAGEVATWLWNRFIGDGGKNFDVIARAQVQAMLAQGRDFSYLMNPALPDANYSASDITKKNSLASKLNKANAQTVMTGLPASDFNKRIGLAINFISMLPYSFAMEGR